MKTRAHREAARGSVLLVVVVFLATAIAALAALSSGRTVHATRDQKVLEDEGRALNSAYAQIHVAMNVVNNSGYDTENKNLEIRAAMKGQNGGTIGGNTATFDKNNGGESTGYVGDAEEIDWLDDPADPEYGLIKSTNVRVYRAREYIRRLQRLKGDAISPVDPTGLSDSYFVLEAAGRAGDTIRLVSALVRENEPFSSFVFFQNRATLGVSGAPRGLVHANDKVAFYFPDGNYMDPVSAVNGFEYTAGANTSNTSLRDANPSAKRIDLEHVDFEKLKTKADLFTGETGLDARIRLYGDGRVRVRQYTPPRFEMVEQTSTYQQVVGYHDEEYTAIEPVQVGTTTVTYEVQVVDHYETETYTRVEKVQVGTETVTKTREEPVYEEQTVTRTRWVKVWQSYSDPEAGDGTAVGGGSGSTGELGEWVWVQEEYQTQEMVQVGTKTVEYTVEEPVYKDQLVTYTRQVPVYRTETRTREEPVYEDQEVTKTRRVNDYETVTETWEEEVYIAPVMVSEDTFTLPEQGSTLFIDGRITSLKGDLKGRLTIVANEKVRVTGNIRYVDDDGDFAMRNGSDYTKAYERNPDYDGNSVLGVIARDDIILTRHLPNQSEVNATLMAVDGRVGIDGFWADEATGELYEDRRSNRRKYLTAEQQETERAYDRESYTRTRRFRKDSLRRIGGIISNNRIMETYIETGSDGRSYVDAGFKRGNMKFDINLLFNPPPNFVEVPRPVLTYFVPILMVRNQD